MALKFADYGLKLASITRIGRDLGSMYVCITHIYIYIYIYICN